MLSNRIPVRNQEAEGMLKSFVPELDDAWVSNCSVEYNRVGAGRVEEETDSTACDQTKLIADRVSWALRNRIQLIRA